ncbi:aromatic prenyltransferase [Colletotrichum graminicola M1.001]|uniref:Aromatic prenyltransferase n=1 Tax=Colletotrichum graminicola (strain M1.001 / M2 / FGSC 10212) TaxID=645133 RepID=E3QPN4_COLGM|nr:aromatic prenyltransferase [Colletotrichum graminicola M1.001]EFQ32811.1 aromatic prenyltransferase [Colletotrichum graminicola M1.001]
MTPETISNDFQTNVDAPRPPQNFKEFKSLVNNNEVPIDPPLNPEHRWWWDRCAPLLNSLLNSAESYTSEEKADHLRVFRDVVVPSFGTPTPRAKVRPLLTYDGSTFEPSWNFTKGNDGVVRYTFEPLGDTAGSEEDPFAGEIGRSLIPILSQVSSDVDLQWYKQVVNEWFVTPEEAVAARQNMPPHIKRIPQLFLAYDMIRSKRMLKAYLFPVLKHFATGATTSDLVFDLIPKLQPFGDKLAMPARKLQKYLATCKEPCLVEMMAIDCVDPSKARVKVYARTTSNSKSVLADVFTLGGTQTDEATLKGVEAAEKVWHLLLDEPQGMAPDQRKDARDMKNLHKGICFAFELKQGVERIDIKAHLPWGQTARSDFQTIENFAQVLRNVGLDSAEKFLKGALETAKLPGRDYTKPGGLSYVSYNYNQNGPYLSSYFSPKIQDN